MEINETGIRGYLKWLKEDQPGIYRALAPKIAQLVPQAFSDHEQSKALGYLCGADSTGGAVPDSFYPGITPYSDDIGVSSASGADVSTVANTGTASPSVVNTISNLVGAVGQIYLAKSQVDLLTKVNDVQLQRAAAGLSPLDTSSLSLNVPQVNVGVAPGTLKAGGLGIAGVLLAVGAFWLAFGGKKAA